MNNTIYAVLIDPKAKKIWTVEQTTKPRPATYAYFVRASSIRNAHRKGREIFGSGISFITREMNAIEKQIHVAHEIYEVD